MTPTNHSKATQDSSSKKAAKSDASQLYISDMLAKMEDDFQKSGNAIMDRMREVGSKMDDLEQNIYGLVRDAGLDEEEDQNSEDLNQSKESAGASSSPSPQKPSSPSHMTVWTGSH